MKQAGLKFRKTRDGKPFNKAVESLPTGFRVEALCGSTRQSLLEVERTGRVLVPQSVPVLARNTRAWVMHEYHLNPFPSRMLREARKFVLGLLKEVQDEKADNLLHQHM